jgi:hypothetical protein
MNALRRRQRRRGLEAAFPGTEQTSTNTNDLTPHTQSNSARYARNHDCSVWYKVLIIFQLDLIK